MKQNENFGHNPILQNQKLQVPNSQNSNLQNSDKNLQNSKLLSKNLQNSNLQNQNSNFSNLNLRDSNLQNPNSLANQSEDLQNLNSTLQNLNLGDSNLQNSNFRVLASQNQNFFNEQNSLNQQNDNLRKSKLHDWRARLHANTDFTDSNPLDTGLPKPNLRTLNTNLQNQMSQNSLSQNLQQNLQNQQFLSQNFPNQNVVNENPLNQNLQQNLQSQNVLTQNSQLGQNLRHQNLQNSQNEPFVNSSKNFSNRNLQDQVYLNFLQNRNTLEESLQKLNFLQNQTLLQNLKTLQNQNQNLTNQNLLQNNVQNQNLLPNQNLFLNQNLNQSGFQQQDQMNTPQVNFDLPLGARDGGERLQPPAFTGPLTQTSPNAPPNRSMLIGSTAGPYLLSHGTTVTLQDALSAIPDFEGDPFSFAAFSEGCDEAKNMVDPQMEFNLTKLIRNKLHGPAKHAIQGRQFPSVMNLVAFLQNLFAPTESLAQLQGKLGRLIQENNEPVVVYGNRARQLMLNIFNTYTRNGGNQDSFKFDTEQETMRCFIRGLKRGIHVNLHRCLNLDAAIREAIESEKEKQAREELRGLEKSQDDQWPRVVKNNSNALPSKNRNNPRRSDDFKINAAIVEKFCDYCKRHKHTEEQCWAKNGYPARPVTCTYCKNRGHSIQECRKKKFQDNRFKRERETISPNQGNEQCPSTTGARQEVQAANCAALKAQSYEEILIYSM